MKKFLTKKSTVFFALLAAAMLMTAFLALFLRDERQLAENKNNSWANTNTTSPPITAPKK